MKISILLPYKENYSKKYAGAVSIFINGVNNFSKFKKTTKIFGNTTYDNILSSNYINIPLKKKFFSSASKIYVENFIKLENKIKSDIIEIHNRPSYLKYFDKSKKRRIVIYFHNDPLKMNGSELIGERLEILNLCEKIIFNSEWTKNRFFEGIDNFYKKSEKISVIYQSTNKIKINLKKKEKLITFVGRLNKSKGYDIFGNAILKILNEFKDWKACVFGDEPREKITFEHKNLSNLGYQSNYDVLKKLEKTSIAVACSTWDEPFGRSSLEASSRGCAVIISNKGGLPESITDGVILEKLNVQCLYKNIKKLILNKKKLHNIQKNSLKNFYLTNEYISKQIDDYRESFFNIMSKKNAKLKILHVTNFNQRHSGRLFYNTGRRINNGLLSLGHTVQTLSDRDEISNNRNLFDIYGSTYLNNKLLEIIGNFTPNLVLFGHADTISNNTIEKIKRFYPKIKFAQWFLDRMDDTNWKTNKKRFTKKLNIMDSNFCTTYPEAVGFSKNKNIFFIPNPVDKSFENLKVFQNKNYKYDLFFALSHGVHRGILKKGKVDEREFFFDKLSKLNNEIKLNLFGFGDRQPVWAEEFKEKLSVTKMALNLSQGKPIKFYSSDRIAQLIGNGILTFIDIKTQLNKIFKNDEVIFYSNLNDLVKKVLFYKNNDKERINISKRGWKKYHLNMNSSIVAKYIIEKTFKYNSEQKYIWE